jgi:hypothetical protein
MKRDLKEMPSLQTVQQKAIYRRDDERTYMINNKKAAQYGNTGAANIQKSQVYSSTAANQMKAEFIRLTVWLFIVGGALC